MNCTYTSTQSRRRSGSPGPGRGSVPVGRLGLLVAVALATSLGLAAPCRAGGLVIELPTLTGVAPGSSGSFDVLLMDTDPVGTPGYNVAEDNFELTLTGAAGFTFTNATVNTSVTYIYVQSTDAAFGLPLSTSTFPNTDFIASDTENAPPNYYRTVNPGDVFGLANVSYTVASNASGSAALTIANIGIATTLTEINGNYIPFTVMNGSLSTVPEPSTLMQAATGLLIAAGAARWRHRRRR